MQKLLEKLYDFAYNQLDPNYYFTEKAENYDFLENLEKLQQINPNLVYLQQLIFLGFLIVQNVKYYFTKR